jgi:hypothetical protein
MRTLDIILTIIAFCLMSAGGIGWLLIRVFKGKKEASHFWRYGSNRRRAGW